MLNRSGQQRTGAVAQSSQKSDKEHHSRQQTRGNIWKRSGQIKKVKSDSKRRFIVKLEVSSSILIGQFDQEDSGILRSCMRPLICLSPEIFGGKKSKHRPPNHLQPKKTVFVKWQSLILLESKLQSHRWLHRQSRRQFHAVQSPNPSDLRRGSALFIERRPQTPPNNTVRRRLRRCLETFLDGQKQINAPLAKRNPIL